MVRIPIGTHFDIVSNVQFHVIGSVDPDRTSNISMGYTSAGDSHPFSFAHDMAEKLIHRRETAAKKRGENPKQAGEDNHISCAYAASDDTLIKVLAERLEKNPHLAEKLINSISIN